MTTGNREQQEEAPAGPLAGLRVLDMTRVLAGPFAAQILGDLGADVIKVEHPGRGDDTRQWGPPFFRTADGDEVAAYYLAANRNKRAIAIDFSQAEGRALILRLVERADVLLENYKVGTLARHGLDHESLVARNPRLIQVSITGFGQTGPWRSRPGYDFLIQALSGLMSITGEPDRPPMKVGVAMADLLTGLYAVIGTLAALAERERSGRGQHLDLSLFEAT
ncbi:MAG: CoA transferase, partial [Alphaproteobacteria bacterium]